ATERRVGDRIPTAARLADYRGLYLGGKPLPIRPPGAWELALRWLRRHKGRGGSLGGGGGGPRAGGGAGGGAGGAGRGEGGGGGGGGRQGGEGGGGVEGDLGEGRALGQAERWPEARAVLKRAEGGVAGGGPEGLVGRVRQAGADQAAGERLEEIPLLSASVK